MKKQSCLFLLMFLFILSILLTGCGAGYRKSASEYDNNKGSSPGHYDSDPAEEPQSPGDNNEEPGNNVNLPTNPEDSIRKVIYNVSLSLYVTDVEKAVLEVQKKVKDLDGYLARADSEVGSSGKEYTNLEVKVPAKSLDSFIGFVKGLGKERKSNTSTNDITDSYYDYQSRLKHAKTQEEQYLKVMEKAETIEDILRVQNALDNVQERIERFQGQINLWDQLVSFSTVNISLSEEPKLVEEKNKDLKMITFEDIGTGIVNGLTTTGKLMVNLLGYLVIAVFYLLIPFTIIGVILFPILLIIRYRRKN